MKSLTTKLKELKTGTNSDLEIYIIDYILEEYSNDDDIKDFFNDLFRSGCSSGMIGGLIYYKDTHRFYDEYYDEIEEMRLEWEESTGEKLYPDGDLKNWFAWFAFEETARKIAEEIGLEI